MKLRNKKTGDAVYVDFQIPLSNNNDALGYYSVTSLKKLNESFEDYMPTEPLIKDEKIRKAVRAWAEAECITKAYLENDYTICRDDDVDVSISFCVPVFKDVGGTSDYTIDELCGEEEE